VTSNAKKFYQKESKIQKVLNICGRDLYNMREKTYRHTKRDLWKDAIAMQRDLYIFEREIHIHMQRDPYI